MTSVDMSVPASTQDESDTHGIADQESTRFPGEPPGHENEGATVAERAKTSGTTRRTPAGNAAKTTRQASKAPMDDAPMDSDARIKDEDWSDGEDRANFSTRIYPKMQAEMDQIINSSKQYGLPRGVNSKVTFIQEAIGRYIEEVRAEVEIPKPPRRRS